MDNLIQAHVWVSGKVQGVFYRSATQETTARLGVNGWVRNLPDGRVEALFEGTKDAVAAAVNWCHQGSPAAQVREVQVEYGQPQGLQDFEIRF